MSPTREGQKRSSPARDSASPILDDTSSDYDTFQNGIVDEIEYSATTALLGDGKSSALALPNSEKRFWFQRSHGLYDPNQTATQPSVFDEPETLQEYRPPPDWENAHRFDPSARWTWGEENAIIRKIDLRIMIFTAIMFMALELDRSNLSQALADNFLDDLGMTTNDYNLGNTVFKLAFLCAELPSQLVAKWVGPDIWVPTQMVVWSLVILYLSYFYKHHELSLRLGFFWTASAFADVLGGFLAFGILHLRGVDNKAGWRWLFLIEGLLTLIVGLLAFFLMPSSPTSTAGWLRGRNGWFTKREEIIMVNRILREDPSKSSMHNREALTPRLLWQSMKDYDLWPIYILGLTFQTPMTPTSNYLTLILRDIGFDTFKTNLLIVPSKVLHVVTMLGLTYAAEIFRELTLTSLIGQLWALPFIIFLNIYDVTEINKWLAWSIMTLLLCYPNGEHWDNIIYAWGGTD
ncbi:hypothetical protein SLS60_006813 [Paraconiothyrium brasiliense]|uniref:MFS transporter n=1 Tax=Paraconiothyrium brasiliense TaxID=300254 RepID=A0ABR3R7M5_9PLEO